MSDRTHPGSHPAPTTPPADYTAPRHFAGHDGRECGEHRTTGHRAWCFDDSEWCTQEIPCRGCELSGLRAALTAARDETARQRERAEQAEDALRELADNRPCELHPRGRCLTHMEKPPCPHAEAQRILAALDRPADPPAKENP